MDTPILPENEIEEITWQDDENRATLFLRSVFVLLSGALIFRTLLLPTGGNWFAEIAKALILMIVFPVAIIWLFFGQGLRPVEWLTDQKYNAWNYGVNFRNWKSQLLWTMPLLVLGIIGVVLFKTIFLKGGSPMTPVEMLTITLILWLSLICLTWFLFGFLWFGCAQGFGPFVATVFVLTILTYGIVESSKLQEVVLTISVYFPFVLLSSYICWKQKSWIPILYTVILLAPIASCIFMY